MRLTKIITGALLGTLAATVVLTQEPVLSSSTAPVEPAATAVAPATNASANSAKQLTREDAEAWLDGYMRYALQRGDVAGAVVAIVKDGQVLLQKGYGYADVEQRTPVDPEATLFRPGSVSKLITWTAVMQLVEQGKIDLDQDVNTYLDFEIPARDGKPVTMRNIMTHTAGFEESLRNLVTAETSKVPPLGDVLKSWVPERITPPGATPAYSNYATTLAGYIVQRVSDQSFDDYVERSIFAPLGMNNSSFRQPLPERLRAGMSKGYALGSGDPKPYEMFAQAPAGSLASTGADMAKFMIAHLNEGGPLLQPRTARMMHETTLDQIPGLNRMALGFY